MPLITTATGGVRDMLIRGLELSEKDLNFMGTYEKNKRIQGQPHLLGYVQKTRRNRQMMTLKEALAITGMTLSDAGDLVGMGKSAISRVKSHDYPNWQNIEAAIIKKMAEAGLFKDDVEIDTTRGRFPWL